MKWFVPKPPVTPTTLIPEVPPPPSSEEKLLNVNVPSAVTEEDVSCNFILHLSWNTMLMWSPVMKCMNKLFDKVFLIVAHVCVMIICIIKKKKKCCGVWMLCGDKSGNCFICKLLYFAALKCLHTYTQPCTYSTLAICLCPSCLHVMCFSVQVRFWNVQHNTVCTCLSACLCLCIGNLKGQLFVVPLYCTVPLRCILYLKLHV